MDFLGFFVKLLLDFHEDSGSLHALHLLETDRLEYLSEFVTEIS